MPFEGMSVVAWRGPWARVRPRSESELRALADRRFTARQMQELRVQAERANDMLRRLLAHFIETVVPEGRLSLLKSSPSLVELLESFE